MRLTRKWSENVAVATLRDIDAVSQKKHRLAYRRINQCFLIVICADIYYNNRVKFVIFPGKRKDVRYGLPNSISALASVQF